LLSSPLFDPRGKGGSCRHAIFVRIDLAVVIPAYADEAPIQVAVTLTVVIWACTRAAAVTWGPDVRLIGLPDSLRKFRKFRKFRVRLTELPDALGDLGGVVWAPREVAVGFGVIAAPDGERGAISCGAHVAYSVRWSVRPNSTTRSSK
jgi:hypothetical protein